MNTQRLGGDARRNNRAVTATSSRAMAYRIGMCRVGCLVACRVRGLVMGLVECEGSFEIESCIKKGREVNEG